MYVLTFQKSRGGGGKSSPWEGPPHSPTLNEVLEWGRGAVLRIHKMWLGGQTESFQNVGGAKVYTMY